jgi:peptidoglycan DL-endopeptidase CwlO
VHQPRRISTPSRILIALATGAAITATAVPVGNADPPPTLDEVRATVDELHEEAAEANERYNVAAEEVDAVERRLERAQNAVKRQEDRLNSLTAELGGFAAAAYRNGGTDPTLQALLADDPAEFLAKASVMDAFTVQQADQLAAIAVERQALEQRKLVAAEELGRSEVIKGVLADEKATVDKLLREQEELLERLTEEERRRLEREREAQLAAALAEREAAAARLSRSEEQTTAPAASEPASEPKPAAASGRAATAVQAALSRVGYPYVYGGRGPSSFDCSGLTRWAWAQAGVSLSASSRSQINDGTRISSDQLQPGDLLFYGSPISHVAMYIGDGQVVHAANPRSGVTVAPAMQAGGSSKPFVGATRPG